MVKRATNIIIGHEPKNYPAQYNKHCKRDATKPGTLRHIFGITLQLISPTPQYTSPQELPPGHALVLKINSKHCNPTPANYY